jgi:acetyl-CoA synthetase
MPMVPEAAVAMLACARIGAIHSVIFGGFSPEAVAGRIIDSSSRLVITADEGLRAGRAIPLKKNVDDALKNPNVKSIEHVVVLKRTGGKIDWQEGRDLWWSDLIANASAEHRPVEMNAEDPLFILYTSGSTGKPKGCCTPPAAIWSMRPPPLNTFSTTIRAIFTGAPPMWAGSPATAICCTARWPAAPP